MSSPLLGIHHITALASDPQRNLEFYTKILGLRLVKQTVNFDDPGTYHLYYGDDLGRPGTILTFFPYPDADRGKRGAGQITAIAFTIGADSLSFWVERLARMGVPFDGPLSRFDEEVISFDDPDGLQVELVARADNRRHPRSNGSIPPEHALFDFRGVTLASFRTGSTMNLLIDQMGFAGGLENTDRVRMTLDTNGHGIHVDIATSKADSGRISAGSVHHIAWRVPTAESQLTWRSNLALAGQNVTPVIDRKYFQSIYYREPGGILYEIATDLPGFAVDEAPDRLGTTLMLPPWLETQRDAIQRHLPPLTATTAA